MWGVIGAIGGALISADAAGDAASTQANAANAASEREWQMYQQNRTDQAPWREAGVNALGKLTSQLDTLNKPFSMESFQADPGYGFRLAEGQKTLERSAAAKGNLLFGGALKSATRYGQDYASNEYANAYNRYNQDNTNIFNRLAAVSGIGQTAAQQIGQQGINVAQNTGELGLQAANARASGYLGQSNALVNGIGDAFRYNQGQNRVNALAGNGYQNQSSPYYSGYTYGTSEGE